VEESGQPAAIARKWHVLGFVLLAGAGAYAVAVSLELGLWRQKSPGEGLFPFITAVAVTIFSLVGLAGTLRTHDTPSRADPDKGEMRATLWRVGAYLVGLVFYALALDALGFIASTIIVVVFILRLAEQYSWRTTLVLAFGATAGCQLLFVRWLGASLPAGYLWDMLIY
jgi:energy-converting hydrogenase Eha subunit E